MDENEETQKVPDWLVVGYPPLKGDDSVGQAAVNGQVWKYPKVVRTMVDTPIPGQRLSLLSFMLFKEPRKLRNGVPVYGYVKVRGSWSDEIQSRYEASKIIREVDSKYQVRIAPTGAWVPITEENAFVKDQLDVRMDRDEKHLRDEAVKEKEATNRRIAREIREREEEVEHGGDIYDDQESLTFYSMRRVTEVRLMEARENQTRQIESIKKTLCKVQKQLKRMERDHPDYDSQWVGRYNEERRKAGVPDYVPSEEQTVEHDSVQFDNIDETPDGSEDDGDGDERKEAAAYVETTEEDDEEPLKKTKKKN